VVSWEIKLSIKADKYMSVKAKWLGFQNMFNVLFYCELMYKQVMRILGATIA